MVNLYCTDMRGFGKRFVKCTAYVLLSVCCSKNCAPEYQVHPVNVDINIFGEYHYLYKKLRNYPNRFFEYLRMEIETFDYILNLTSGKMQKKWKNCHGNPIVQEERLVLTLRYVEIIFVPMCSSIFSS